MAVPHFYDLTCMSSASLMNTFRRITNLNIDIANKVVAQVVTHIHLLHLPVLLLHLCEHLLSGKQETKTTINLPGGFI